MQFTQILTLLSAMPLLVAANPVAIEESSILSRSALERRGGIDFCGSDLRHVGDSCTFGSTKDDPHACGIKDRTVVLVCKGGKWAIESHCNAGELCQCNKGIPARGDLVCR